MFNISKITRKNIRDLTPYSSARDEFNAEAKIWLDANENPNDTGLNRYPDPYQMDLKNAISKIKDVNTDKIFVGNGSDEVIDLLFRAFCEPQLDRAFIFPPTYGMYEVSAKINNIEIVELSLKDNYELPDIEVIKNDIQSKGLLFICSPNNPTGNLYPLKAIKELADNFQGLVVVDEAYIDFSNSESAISLIHNTLNLVVLQTLSKAYGMAGARLGMAFTNPQIIRVLNKIKPPYNVNTLSQRKGVETLKNKEIVKLQVSQTKAQREMLITALKGIQCIKKIYPTKANFILVEFNDAQTVFTKLRSEGIIVRDRTKQIEGALRITIGSPEENNQLIKTLKQL